MKRPRANETLDSKKRKRVKKADYEDSSITYMEGELGIIESVSVQNFMCHENLTIHLEPHLNFIIGQNGSGKSAILTAIILALGGKSSSTDRFTNIKGFVKKEKNKAKIEVVLRNTGNLAYKPEVYGAKICVIREFNKEGFNKYQIKSESGTIVSQSKSELTNIMEAMDIMVECPVSVLTQTTSKKFLISKEAKGDRLYEFFYKGTGLEMLEERYKGMDITKQEAEAELNKKKQSLPDLKKDLKKWKRFLDSSRKISDLRNEKIWAGVIEMEKRLQEKEKELTELEEEFEEYKRTLDGCKKSLAEKKSEIDDLNARKIHIKAEMEKYRKGLEDLKTTHENYAASYRRNKGTFEKLKSDKKKLEDDIEGLKKCIYEQQTKDQRNLEEEDKRRLEAVQNLKAENVKLEDKLKTLRETINTTLNEESNFRKVEETLRAEGNHHVYELNSIENNLTASRSALKSKVNAFGEHTEKVLREIQSMRNRFRKQPVGPLGLYLEVKDPKWAAAAEYAIHSAVLNSFCVDNYHDSQLLKEILRKYYARPPSIIISQYEAQMFDVRQGKAESNYPTVLDMLTIKNHLVANCLIDQAAIEKKILVDNESAATELMRKQPKNCTSAYFMNCDQICFDPYRFYSYRQRLMRSRLCGVGAEDIKNMEKVREEKMVKINEIKKKIETLKNAYDSLPKKIEDLERKVVHVSTMYKKNLMEMKELERKEETKNVDCLQEDLQNLHNHYEQKIEDLRKCSQVVTEMDSKKTDLESQIATLSASLKSLNDEDYQRLLMKINQVSKLKENFESGKRKYELEIRMKENKCTMERKVLEESREKFEIALSKAETMCPRIETERSYEEITRLISETEKVVEEQSNCDRESLSQKYKEKLENLTRAELELKKIERYLLRIGEMLKCRNDNFQKIRKNTELLIGLTFATILSGNGYKGFLSFDQVNKTLNMEVSPRAADNIRKNHSSLSGGERSFVTIALLLALWERTRMPFRILDEYDVFMDSSNRQLSVDLFCTKAASMSQTQFVFLSPLDLARLPALDCINIIEMAAPERKTEDG